MSDHPLASLWRSPDMLAELLGAALLPLPAPPPPPPPAPPPPPPPAPPPPPLGRPPPLDGNPRTLIRPALAASLGLAPLPAASLCALLNCEAVLARFCTEFRALSAPLAILSCAVSGAIALRMLPSDWTFAPVAE